MSHEPCHRENILNNKCICVHNCEFLLTIFVNNCYLWGGGWLLDEPVLPVELMFLIYGS